MLGPVRSALVALALFAGASALGGAVRAQEAGVEAPAGPTLEEAIAAESAPVDEAEQEVQRSAGYLGLAGWVVLGVAGGLWLGLRWRRTHKH